VLWIGGKRAKAKVKGGKPTRNTFREFYEKGIKVQQVSRKGGSPVFGLGQGGGKTGPSAAWSRETGS